jgi:hypothetical protein
MTKRNGFILSGLLLFSALGLTAGPAPDKNLVRAVQSINACDVYSFCKTLALPEFAGRLTGSEGYTKAARWAAAKFKEWGLKPINAGEGYLQAYPSPYTIVDKASLTLLLPEGKPAADKKQTFKEAVLEPDKDFLPLLYTDSGQAEAEVVFAGWGISAPELGYDDYAGLDVRGKFILCFRGTPDHQDLRYETYDQHRTRMKFARDKGALGIIYIYPEVNANPNGDWLQGFTPAVISERAADMLFKEKGVTCADLSKSMAALKRPLSFPLGSRVRYNVESRHFPKAVGYNIMGYVEGSDPILKKECVIYGGHFDHCGRHLGFLYPGADDNASGSATVMGIGRAFTTMSPRPKRSVVVVLFGGEELGLQGSAYFAEHIPPQFAKVAAMFNFDMTGEGDGAWCGVSAEPAAFQQTIEEADKASTRLKGTRVIRNIGVRSSDFAPFFLKGIPCASLGSTGPHLAYHEVGDTIYRINPDIMADIAKLSVAAGYAWAQR